LKTIVYIDGYNLYYSLLRNTTYKWLDVVKLLENVIRIQKPSANVVMVKYFTAPVLANYASHGADSHAAQNAYHRALKISYPDRLEIIYGRHSPEKSWQPVVVENEPLDRKNKVRVWQLQEKQTDVNLALHMYRDAVSREYELLVLVTNDTDFEPLLKTVRLDTKIEIGLVTPLPKRQGEEYRRPSVSLKENADWTRIHILDDELIKAQLPPKIPTKKKPILKPNYW
jgi:uncharacterized LabA/DUF88 family protein